MNRKWKIFWIVSAAIAGIGGMFLIAGLVMGVSVREIQMRFPNGIGFHPGAVYHSEDHAEHDGEAMEFGGIRVLEVDVSHLEVNVIATSEKKIRVEEAGVDERLGLRIRQEGEKLNIRTENEHLRINHGGVVNIYIPYGIELAETDISVGAGALNVNMEKVRSGHAKISVGAGDANLSNVETDQIEIACGAGNVTADEIRAYEFDVQCGLGNVDLSVRGEKEDYNYDVQCGMGSVDIDGDSYAGVGTQKKHHHELSQRMHIKCGMGSVTVNFE